MNWRGREGPHEGHERGWRPRIAVAVDADWGDLAQELSQEGYAVSQAPDGHGLFELLSSALIELEPLEHDLVLAEVLPEGWGGLEVLRGLRQSDWSTPCVLVAEEARPGVRAEAHGLAGFVIERPVSSRELVAYVRCLVPLPGLMPAGLLEGWLAWDELAFDAERGWDELAEKLRRDGILHGVRPAAGVAP